MKTDHSQDFNNLNNDIIKIRDETKANKAEIDTNKDEIKKKLRYFDYRTIQTQKALYEKAIADGIEPGDFIELSLKGQRVLIQASGLDNVSRRLTLKF